MSLPSVARAGALAAAMTVLPLLATPTPANAASTGSAVSALVGPARVLQAGLGVTHGDCGFCGLWDEALG